MTVRFNVKAAESQPAEPQVDAGKALIYVVEDQKFKLVRDITVRVGLDGAWVGATRGSSYVYFNVEPGEHHLCVDWVADLLPTGRLVSYYGLTAEAGKVYYFRARTTSSPGNGYENPASIDLDLVNSDEGRYLVSSSRLSVSNPKK